MGIREQMNKNPAITTGITISIIVLALAFIMWQANFLPGSGEGAVGKIWYTTDDGKTFIADDVAKSPNFKTSDGKDAYQVAVYKCDGTPRVAYMMRLPAAVIARRDEAVAKAKAANQPPPIDEMTLMESLEIKLPGQKDWVLQRSVNGQKIMQTRCPEGTKNPPEVYEP